MADQIELLNTSRSGRYRHGMAIARLHAGDVVGETALLQGTLRNATVATLAPVNALRIDSRRFANSCVADPASGLPSMSLR